MLVIQNLFIPIGEETMRISQIAAAVKTQVNNKNQQQQNQGNLDSTWDYAAQMSLRARDSLQEQIVAISEARAFLMGAGRYDGEASVIVSSMSRDLEKASEYWTANNNRCIKQTGVPETASEHALILDICSNFIQIVENILSTHSLSVARLAEIVNEVYIAYKQQTSNDATNVAVVTDVEIKNVI